MNNDFIYLRYLPMADSLSKRKYMTTIRLRQITAIPTLLHWRTEVLRNMFRKEPSARLIVANRTYYRTHIADGSHSTYVAEVDNTDCGCGSVIYHDEPPTPDNPNGRCACLTGIYVREAFRHRGIAREIVRHLIDEAIIRGCGNIYIETTRKYIHVSESFGFSDMPGITNL